MKLIEIENVIMGLNKVSNKKLPVELSYAAAVNLKILSEKHKDVMEQREKILRETCIKDDNGNPVTKENEETKKEEYAYETDAAKKEVIDKVNELYNIEEKIEFRKIKYELIKETENNTRYDILTAQDISSLLFMIE